MRWTKCLFRLPFHFPSSKIGQEKLSPTTPFCIYFSGPSPLSEIYQLWMQLIFILELYTFYTLPDFYLPPGHFIKLNNKVSFISLLGNDTNFIYSRITWHECIWSLRGHAKLCGQLIGRASASCPLNPGSTPSPGAQVSRSWCFLS